MRLGTCLLPEGLTLQGAHHKLAGFCSALVAGYYAAVDTDGSSNGTTVDLAMVAYPFSLRSTASFNTAMICRLLQAITNFRA